MKISVIMPSYLSVYENSSTNRPHKFLRAVNSFLSQQYDNKELIIISDGCEITNALYDEHYRQHTNIRLIIIKKQPLFSGIVRQYGILVVTGSLICYLDTDDQLGPNHLSAIVSNFENNDIDWCFYDDYIRFFDLPSYKPARRHIHAPEQGLVGTSSIAHRNLPDFNWIGCDGYGHDWLFVEKLLQNKKYNKLEGGNYLVCHVPKSFES